MKHCKTAFREQLPVFLAQLVLCGTMVGVYALLGSLTRSVLLGACVGTAVSMLNHGGLILSLLRAEECESPERGRLMAQGMLLRLVLMVGVLALAMKLGGTDPIATLLPLILMRIALFVGGLLIKKNAKGELKE